MKRAEYLWVLGLLVLLFIAVAASLGSGQYSISSHNILKFLSGDSEALSSMEKNIILHIRLPRVIAAVLCGASLSVSGVALQSMYRNPMVSPGVLGVLSGSAFGAALGLSFFDNWYLTQFCSFGFGCIAVMCTWGLSSLHKRGGILVMLLAGMIVNSLFTSLLSLVKYLADPYDKLPAIVYWLMGSLSHVSLDTVLLCVVPVFLIIVSLLWVAPQLNACSLGENQAKALGVNLVLLRLVVIGGCTALSALTVTLAGMIGWVGLAVPHIVRLLMGSNARITIPCSALGGSLFLLATDNISRNFTTSEIPVGILTSLVGIPVFAWALKKAESRWVSC